MMTFSKTCRLRAARLLACTTIPLFVAVLGLPVGTANAQSAEGTTTTDSARDRAARELYQAGRDAFEAGEYESALAHFRDALSLSGRPQLYFNIGVAADRLRRDAEALEAFEAYLRLVPDSSMRVQVEARVAILRGTAARTEDSSLALSPADAAGTLEGDLADSDATPRDRSQTRRRRVRIWSVVGASVVAVLALGLGLGLGLRDDSDESNVDVRFTTLRGRP